MIIQPGQLSEIVTINHLDADDNMLFFAKAWAKIEDKNGLENLETHGVSSIATVDFTIRHIEGVDTTFEIIHDNTKYNIQAIERIGRRNYLKLTTQAKD